jgi:signal transduction histidine kinase
LAVSYGIVREHGGEISAFNVYPHGAAVVVELPLARTVKKSAERIGVEA